MPEGPPSRELPPSAATDMQQNAAASAQAVARVANRSSQPKAPVRESAFIPEPTPVDETEASAAIRAWTPSGNSARTFEPPIGREMTLGELAEMLVDQDEPEMSEDTTPQTRPQVSGASLAAGALGCMRGNRQ